MDKETIDKIWHRILNHVYGFGTELWCEYNDIKTDQLFQFVDYIDTVLMDVEEINEDN